MSSLDSTLPRNTTSVHPTFLFVNGWHYVPYAKYFYLFLCFVCMVSVLGNSFVMFILYTESSLHTPKYMVIFNLAVADLGLSTVLIPDFFATFLLDSHYISFDACLVYLFIYFCFANIASLILTVMAYDRMLAICLPLRYHAIITMPAIAVTFSLVWAFTALFFLLVVALITRLSFCHTIVVIRNFCASHFGIVGMACDDLSPNIIMAYLWDILFLYLPLILIILSYVFIAGALFKIASWEGRLKAIKTCSTQLMVAGIYYLPYICTFIASRFHRIDPYTETISSSLSLALPTMLDPIIYVLNVEEIKEFSKKKFKRKKKKRTEMNKKGNNLPYVNSAL